MNDHEYRSIYQGESYQGESAYPAPGMHSSYHQWLDRSSAAAESGAERFGGGRGVAEVIVMEPHTFDEISKVIQSLREYKSVVINLSKMDLDTAQRAIDFVSGGTYAIDGNQEQIGEKIFLFTPNTIKISAIAMTAPSSAQPSPVPNPVPPLLYRR